MIRETAEIIRTGDRFLVVTHVSPDGDAVGSLLGLTGALTEMGKTVTALCADAIPDTFGFLPGVDRITASPDTVELAPEWIVSVDAAEDKRISGDISRFRDRAKLINIDHHGTNPLYGDVNLVVPHATSTAELVVQCLKEAGHTISRSTAECLYTGIITDTGGFRFSGVNGDTLRIAGDLIDTGFDPYEVTRALYEEYPLTRVLLERLMLERMELLLDDKLCVGILYADDFPRVGADVSETENLVDRLREIRGVEVGMLITGLPSGMTRVSLRSKGTVDVAEVAGKLGGGGHAAAAGIKSRLSPEEVKEKLVSSLAQAFRSSSATGSPN